MLLKTRVFIANIRNRALGILHFRLVFAPILGNIIFRTIMADAFRIRTAQVPNIFAAIADIFGAAPPEGAAVIAHTVVVFLAFLSTLIEFGTGEVAATATQAFVVGFAEIVDYLASMEASAAWNASSG